MQNFDYMTPTRLIFGKGAVEQLADAIRPYGKRVLLYGVQGIDVAFPQCSQPME